MRATVFPDKIAIGENNSIDRAFSQRDQSFVIVNDSTLMIEITVLNPGDRPARPQCWVSVYGPSETVVTFIGQSEVAPSEMATMRARISGIDAPAIADVEASACKVATE